LGARRLQRVGEQHTARVGDEHPTSDASSHPVDEGLERGGASPFQRVFERRADGERLALHATTELVNQPMSKRHREGNGETGDHDHEQVGRAKHQSSPHASLAW
jgi:hypothetical protein